MHLKRTRRALVLPLVALTSCLIVEEGRDGTGSVAAVTAGHPLAADAGLRVLQNGGNAMDAAITMAGVLAVARPHMNGLGGDMFLIYYDAATGEAHALNGSGRSGTDRTLAGLRAEGLEHMPEIGPLSVSVPGAVGGWWAALERFGTISWSEALQPAADLAGSGLPVSERLALDIAEQVTKLRQVPEAARIFLPGGQPPETGAVLPRPDLAGTLGRLQDNGPAEIYTGHTAEKIAEYLAAKGGLVTAQDLADYAPQWVAPIRAPYHDLDVLAFPPNTQGVALLAELTILSSIDVRSLGHNTPEYLHVITEAIRLAVADRDSSVADPDYMRVTVDDLLNPERLERMGAGIDPAGMASTALIAQDNDHPNTVYLSVIDEAGNAVSLIQSLFHSFGSGLVVPGTGIVLQNRGSLFRFDASHPNVFGPGRRPYHTLSPAMVLKDGAPWLAFGTPGGDGQTHTLLQVLHNIMFFDMSPQAAIDAPRLRRLPSGALAIEDRVPSDVLDALRDRGYDVLPREGWTAEFGGAQAILVMADGTRRSGADRRREGWTRAY